MENERDFTYLGLVFSQLRRSMMDETVARKLFLLLNPDRWAANPGLKTDRVWMDILEKVGLEEKKAEAKALAAALAAGFSDADGDDDEE